MRKRYRKLAVPCDAQQKYYPQKIKALTKEEKRTLRLSFFLKAAFGFFSFIFGRYLNVFNTKKLMYLF